MYTIVNVVKTVDQTLNFCSCSYIYTALGSLYKKNCTDSTSVTYIVDPFGSFGNDIVAEVSRFVFIHVVTYVYACTYFV